MKQYVITELVKSTKGNERRRAQEFPEWAERSARLAYDELRNQYPDTIFELLLIEHTEECLDFVVQKPKSPAPAQPPASEEDLAGAIIRLVQFKNGWESQAEGEVVALIAAHDAETLRRAAERAEAWRVALSPEDDEAETLRAAIMDEGGRV
jgi:hypothetical protein